MWNILFFFCSLPHFNNGIAVLVSFASLRLRKPTRPRMKWTTRFIMSYLFRWYLSKHKFYFSLFGEASLSTSALLNAARRGELILKPSTVWEDALVPSTSLSRCSLSRYRIFRFLFYHKISLVRSATQSSNDVPAPYASSKPWAMESSASNGLCFCSVLFGCSCSLLKMTAPFPQSGLPYVQMQQGQQIQRNPAALRQYPAGASAGAVPQARPGARPGVRGDKGLYFCFCIDFSFSLNSFGLFLQLRSHWRSSIFLSMPLSTNSWWSANAFTPSSWRPNLSSLPKSLVCFDPGTSSTSKDQRSFFDCWRTLQHWMPRLRKPWKFGKSMFAAARKVLWFIFFWFFKKSHIIFFHIRCTTKGGCPAISFSQINFRRAKPFSFFLDIDWYSIFDVRRHPFSESHGSLSVCFKNDAGVRNYLRLPCGFLFCFVFCFFAWCSCSWPYSNSLFLWHSRLSSLWVSESTFTWNFFSLIYLRYLSYGGQSISIPLIWGSSPKNTKSVVLVMYDMDTESSFGFSYLHWLVTDLPKSGQILSVRFQERKKERAKKINEMKLDEMRRMVSESTFL